MRNLNDPWVIVCQRAGLEFLLLVLGYEPPRIATFRRNPQTSASLSMGHVGRCRCLSMTQDVGDTVTGAAARAIFGNAGGRAAGGYRIRSAMR